MPPDKEDDWGDDQAVDRKVNVAPLGNFGSKNQSKKQRKREDNNQGKFVFHEERGFVLWRKEYEVI